MGLDYEEATHYIDMARANELDQKYGRNPRFLLEASIGFKRFLNNVIHGVEGK